MKHVLPYIFFFLSLIKCFYLHAQDYTYKNLKKRFDYTKKEIYFYRNNTNYHRAFSLLKDNIYLADKTKNKLLMADSYFNYIDLIICFNPEINIHEIFDNTIQIYQEEINFKGVGLLTNLKGIYYLKKLEPEKAIEEIEKAYTIISKHGFLEELPKIYYSKALYYHQTKQYPLALEYLERCLPNNNKYQKNFFNAKILWHIADTYLALSQIENARINASKALSIAKEYNFPEIRMQIHELFTKIEKNSANPKKALYHTEQVSIEQSIVFNISKLEKAYHAIDGINNILKDKVIAAMHKERVLIKEAQRVNKLTAILSSILLIITSLFAITLYRNNQIKLKTNDLLVKKNSDLQKEAEKAEKALRTKADFLSAVSHELRTPLYAVTGLAHILLEENPKESQKEHLKALKFSGEYLLNFINDILQINKIDAKKLEVDPSEISIKKLLEEVSSSFKQTAKEKNNTLIVDIDKDIPKYSIGDYLKLSQIFINLIGNALKFTENGKITISAKVKNTEPHFTTINFMVKDTGIGISKEMQKTIFESFSQGSIQINRRYGGTGLGLTIVKKLLHLLDSDIYLESTPGKGAAFYFSIDFKNTGDQKTPLQTNSNTKKIPVKESIFDGLHLLLVEDNKINQVISQKMLNLKKMSCDIAENGYEAIEKAKKNQYDAILMDIHMPGISGLKATQEIRKFDTDTPIIALTAVSLDQNIEDFFLAGCNDVITKPSKPAIFYEKIAQTIGKS